MTQNEIIHMARKAGFSDHYLSTVQLHDLERFAALVAAHEREACAKVCDELRDEDGYEAWNTECAAAIRARGNYGTA